MIDLTLLEVPTFRASVVGGFLFRIGIGATPFLLPLMLQAGFGLSAFNSGLLTFAAAAGAMLMKVTAPPILRRFGFRRVLLANALISSAFIAANGLFQPTTPHLLILAVLLAGGFFRSLQFTCINTLGYADIERARMSRATSFASMMQQLSLTVGVGTGALLLHLSAAARGGEHLATGRLRRGVLRRRHRGRGLGARLCAARRRRGRGGERPAAAADRPPLRRSPLTRRSGSRMPPCVKDAAREQCPGRGRGGRSCPHRRRAGPRWATRTRQRRVPDRTDAPRRSATLLVFDMGGDPIRRYVCRQRSSAQPWPEAPRHGGDRIDQTRSGARLASGLV